MQRQAPIGEKIFVLSTDTMPFVRGVPAREYGKGRKLRPSVLRDRDRSGRYLGPQQYYPNDDNHDRHFCPETQKWLPGRIEDNPDENTDNVPTTGKLNGTFICMKEGSTFLNLSHQ